MRIACFSTRNQTFSGNEGLLFTLGVKSTTAKPETYEIKIDNIIAVDGNGNELSLDPCVGKLILSPKLASGDVNGDGTVNISDATQVMAYILGNTFLLAMPCSASSDKVLFNVVVRATPKLAEGTKEIMFKGTIFNTSTEESKFADSKSYFDFTTGIENIEPGVETSEYYNLHGQRVANPSNGIFIKKQGSKATKVIL